MIHTQASPTPDGAILHDAAIKGIDDNWFDVDWWARQNRATAQTGGRGGIVFVATPAGSAALRHYRRGGWVAKFNADHYLWTGAARSRAFAEFHLLAHLHDAGMPVPRPIAARYRRQGLRYSADLLTKTIDDAATLAQRLGAGTIDAELAAAVGQTVARFHAIGSFHADLNAHNVLIDHHKKVWLLDFDRGRLRKPDLAWQQANLARLRRSLLKVGGRAMAKFDESIWHPLLAAYHAALGVAP